jgi:hypothetical protein
LTTPPENRLTSRILDSSSANAFSCIAYASMPLAYNAPTTLPALVPET